MHIKRNIIFAPESRKKDGIPVTKNVPIRMRVIFASQRIEFTTGYRIDVEKWDTCLSLPKIFEHKQDQSHQLMPYPLKFRKSYEEKLKLFPILLCHFIKRFGTRAFE